MHTRYQVYQLLSAELLRNQSNERLTRTRTRTGSIYIVLKLKYSQTVIPSTAVVVVVVVVAVYLVCCSWRSCCCYQNEATTGSQVRSKELAVLAVEVQASIPTIPGSAKEYKLQQQWQSAVGISHRHHTRKWCKLAIYAKDYTALLTGK